MTTFIRTPNRETLLEALRSAVLVTTDEDGEEVIKTASHNHALRIIGTITRVLEPATDDSEAVTETLEGYHANLKTRDGTVPEALQEYVIPRPNNPSEVFA